MLSRNPLALQVPIDRPSQAETVAPGCKSPGEFPSRSTGKILSSCLRISSLPAAFSALQKQPKMARNSALSWLPPQIGVQVNSLLEAQERFSHRVFVFLLFLLHSLRFRSNQRWQEIVHCPGFLLRSESR